MPQVRQTLLLDSHDLDADAALTSVQHTGLDYTLHKILLDVYSVSSLFNHRAQDQSMNLVTYQEMVLSIIYRLIEFQPLGAPQRRPDLHAAYHTGLTIFMMTIFLQYQRRRVVDYRLTFQCLREVIETSVLRDHSELALWAMVIGGIWVWDAPGREWLSLKLMGVVRELELQSWREARGVLRKFPWVNCIHDESGEQVWEWLHHLY